MYIQKDQGLTRVDENTLESSDGMNSNDRVDALDGFASNVVSNRFGSVRLSDPRMDGGEGGEVGLEGGGEGGVKSVSRREAENKRKEDASVRVVRKEGGTN